MLAGLWTKGGIAMAHACILRAGVLAGVLTILVSSSLYAEPIRLPDGRTLVEVNFERHVHALLDRQGCNGGACHGSSQGRGGGFNLSLFAEAPERDHTAILHTSRGRLVNFIDPDQSLLLLKPTRQVGHDGGVRLVKDSWEYRTLRRWLTDGAPRDPGSGTVTRVEVEPRELFFTGLAQEAQVKVWVTFADGSREDMTPFCDFRLPQEADTNDATKNASTVEVSRLGVVTSRRPGTSWVRAFYRGQAAPARVLVAHPRQTDYPALPENNIIDREVFAQLRRLNIVPAELTSDAQFLRRVTIDTTGSLPMPDEARRFQSDRHPGKRDKKIDELLSHPRHAALWSTLMIDLLQPRWGSNHNIDTIVWPQMAHDWFRKRFQENVPFDQIVRGVLVATSREHRSAEAWLASQLQLDEAARTGFFTDYSERDTVDVVWRSFNGNGFFAEDTAERLAHAFLGIDLHCAQCHKHSLGPWTPADQRSFVNVVARVRVGVAPDLKPILDQELASRDKKTASRLRHLFQEVWVDPAARHFPDSRTGAALPVRLPGGPILDSPGDPREQLWRWLIARDNPYFARHIVNLVWAHYFGIGLVEPVGSICDANPGHYPVLLDALANDFIASGFDLRRLERTILQSRVYQLAAQTNATNAGDRELFSHAMPFHLPRRMFAGLLQDTLGGPLPWPKGMPSHLRALETTAESSLVFSEHRMLGAGRESLFRLFNRHELAQSCEREGRGYGSLHIASSLPFDELIKSSLRVPQLVKSTASDLEVIEELAQIMLTRPLRSSERQAVVNYLRERSDSRQVRIENVIWAFANSREFLSRH